ncbi:4-carboxy-4-hydroxy-2-oxoadipate aldolase/oxaloacetate decarboxylase [Cupriavidus taiwanensis]|uniref:4-carboxy-4-hydroxy-2-oxoadipate aldolase/oxaloacetate decarboxylase n=1 Tax=Cupriavidus taiwanensis TaxID=164546 RepID=UPI001573288D|nr:4-carboxy-4-hydroxy-2-oxoadipate aldolase/oxaloacetate decarboxylase [Cupriavidus taiwanensis]NSX14717.1 4-carboxy-4-hydroxy-2-oxoadipate aldolase/oxaloacetate decarboxylase [Cupriavidus taiwanensis]
MSLPIDRIDPRETTQADFARTAPEIVDAARGIPTATLHEAAGKIGALPSVIKPVAPGFRLCGPAATVHAPGGDNLWLHRAIYAARPGDVLVVSVSDAFEHGYWGEVMSTASQVRGLAGLVIDGCVRDGVLLEEIGFPVFARGLCIRGTGKDFGARGWINAPVAIGEVTVHAGDLIVGDGDGVVCIPRDRAAKVVDAGQAREANEAEQCRRLRAGETTLDIFGWN